MGGGGRGEGAGQEIGTDQEGLSDRDMAETSEQSMMLGLASAGMCVQVTQCIQVAPWIHISVSR